MIRKTERIHRLKKKKKKKMAIEKQKKTFTFDVKL